MPNFKKGLGTNIQLIRKAKGLTQEELAGAVGIYARQLSKIETGTHFPSCATLESICTVLDVQPGVLFDFNFLEESDEAVMTGTDSNIVYRVEDQRAQNVTPLFEQHQNPYNDDVLFQAAKNLNEPVFRKEEINNQVVKIDVFFPDGRRKSILNKDDSEYKKNMLYMIKRFKEVSKDKRTADFVISCLDSMKDDEALKKVYTLSTGMMIARGLRL